MSREKQPDLESGFPDEPDQQKSQQSNSPTRPTDYFNYYPPLLILILEILVWVILALLCFTAPNGGLSAVFKDGSSYIGVLRKCSDSSCDPYMVSGSSSSISSPSSSSTSSPSSLTSSSDTTDSTTESIKSLIEKRDLSSFDLANFFLSTGLATLACFWLMSYTLLFILIRYFSSSLPNNNPSSTPKKDEISLFSFKRENMRNIIKMLKKFAWRSGRIFTFVLTFIILGIAGDCTLKLFTVTGGKGIGMGIILLWITFILLILINLLEMNRNCIRRKADLTIWGFRCLQLPKHKSRMIRKWQEHDKKLGDPEYNEKEAMDAQDSWSGGSHSNSRTRGDKNNRRSNNDDYDNVPL
ncbi:uncharacterized protein IL334_005220 [Kwoniella shivajii]|uniref:Uncharacterized protein n=1 Tax=Kwoniella shivajii TaxID=564305 RepID=A0ABZ1D2I7_9TREE|nr:hypothetical protein IL334_005220 [Kwoniella shivajii]